MDYVWLKALHIAAVATWVGGMLVAAVTVAAFSVSPTETPGGAVILDAVRSWDRRVTAPAMFLVWGLGLTLALKGGWFAAPWLILKLVLVLLLSVLHGLLSGTLRRLGRPDSRRAPAFLAYAPTVIVTCVALIVVLVVIKPI